MQVIKIYLMAFFTFLVIDIIWLVLIAKDIYKDQLGFIMAKSPNWTAAILFYLLYIAGLVYFVISPAIAAGDWQLALKNGILFGFITYATYDLTNLATLENWPIKITIIDLIWGSFVGGSVSTITYFLSKLFSIR